MPEVSRLKKTNTPKVTISSREVINQYGVTVVHFFCEEKELGHMIRTYSPGWYEVFLNNLRNYKRVRSEEEAAEWLFQQHFVDNGAVPATVDQQ